MKKQDVKVAAKLLEKLDADVKLLEKVKALTSIGEARVYYSGHSGENLHDLVRECHVTDGEALVFVIKQWLFGYLTSKIKTSIDLLHRLNVEDV